MRGAPWIGLLAAFTILVSVGPSHADKRIALLIGNGAYQNIAKLSNPPRDADALAELFRKAKFDVVQVWRDLGQLEFKRALREFNLAALDADIAVIFIAGHGIEINGINYLLPVDAKLRRDFDVEDEAVTLDRVIRAVEPAKRLRLIILDACRDNPFVRTVQRTAAVRSVVTGLGKVEPTMSDTLIAYAAKAGSYSDDGDGANSPFTMALLNHILEPGVDIRLALGRVRDEVLKNTRNQQEPFVYGSLGGTSISLAPAAAPPPPKASLSEDVGADYDRVERINTKEAWELFISHNKAGYYVDLARQRLRLLQDAAAAKKKAKDEAAASADAEARAKTQHQEGEERIATERREAEERSSPETEAKRQAAAEVTKKGDEEEVRIKATEQQRIASLPQGPIVEPPERSVSHLTALARSLQAELKRVGCDPGPIDATWGSKAQQALEEFARFAKVSLSADQPSSEALQTVMARKRRVCPPKCKAREKEVDGSCIAKERPEPKPHRRANQSSERKAVSEPDKPRSGCVKWWGNMERFNSAQIGCR